MTVGVSFGEARQAAFEWAGAKAKDTANKGFPSTLRPPPANPDRHSNVVLSLTLPDASTYTFGRDLNLLWKHGILAEKPPTGRQAGGEIDVEEGRISIIAWGWVDQFDELDAHLPAADGGPVAAVPGYGGGGGSRSEFDSRGMGDFRGGGGKANGGGYGFDHGRGGGYGGRGREHDGHRGNGDRRQDHDDRRRDDRQRQENRGGDRGGHRDHRR
jgi:hypothetical protein